VNSTVCAACSSVACGFSASAGSLSYILHEILLLSSDDMIGSAFTVAGLGVSLISWYLGGLNRTVRRAGAIFGVLLVFAALPIAVSRESGVSPSEPAQPQISLSDVTIIKPLKGCGEVDVGEKTAVAVNRFTCDQPGEDGLTIKQHPPLPDHQ
jgi:hypothetical protein